MKRLGWMILVATALFIALPLAAGETEMQCIINCPPGVNACSNCCMAQYEAAKGPCYGDCQTAQKSCFDAAWNSCKNSSNPQYCYQAAQLPCQAALFSCERNCASSVQIAGGCPGEVPPQKCPYDCQMWNPASQSCIGPAMNGCPPMQASMQLQVATMDEMRAAEAKKDADEAAAHTAKLQAEAKKNVKGKKKSK